jgi:hypothetical protein
LIPVQPRCVRVFLFRKHGHENKRADTDQHDDSENKPLHFIVHIPAHHLSHVVRDKALSCGSNARSVDYDHKQFPRPGSCEHFEDARSECLPIEGDQRDPRACLTASKAWRDNRSYRFLILLVTVLDDQQAST